MLHPCTWPALADTGTRGQGMVQPVEADFFDFDPAIAHRLQAALLERLAMTIAVEQGKAAMQWARSEQRDQVAHGKVPSRGDCREGCQSAVTCKCMGGDICVTGTGFPRVCQTFQYSLRGAGYPQWPTAILPACLCLILERKACCNACCSV